MANDNYLTLLIDVKNSRIHLRSSTLKELGNPSFVFFGYQHETNKLMVLAADSGQRGALRLHFDSRRACYVHSKGLIDGIRKISGMMPEIRSYQLKGSIMEDAPAILFSFEEATINEELKNEEITD